MQIHYNIVTSYNAYEFTVPVAGGMYKLFETAWNYLSKSFNGDVVISVLLQESLHN